MLNKLPAKVDFKEAFSRAIVSVHLQGGYTLAPIGDEVPLHGATVCRLIVASEGM